MRIFKNKAFNRCALKVGLNDNLLIATVLEMNKGLTETNLGNHVYKKRIGMAHQGKRGGLRTICQ